MNRSYEVMYILRPDLEDADVDKSIETFSGYITTGEGTVKNVEKMGRRRLAYTVNKFNDGIYVLLIVEAPASLISEIERRLRVTEQVIKFITVRTDEEEKRVAKIKAHRAAHVKRSAQPQENPAEAADNANNSVATPQPAPVAPAAPTPEIAAVEAATTEAASTEATEPAHETPAAPAVEANEPEPAVQA